MEAVEVARNVLQQQRRWTRLTGIVTSFEKRRVVIGITLGNAHSDIPFVGDDRKVRIQRGSQLADEIGKRIFEVAILALAEAVPRHVDVASEVALVRIEGRNGAAFFGREKLRQDGAAVIAKFVCERLPVVCRNSRFCGHSRRGRGDVRRTYVHAVASFLMSSRLRSAPQRYPAKPPLLPTTRGKERRVRSD